MTSLLNIARSAIQAQREALNITGQNIANASTEGYRRREAALSEISGSQSELTAKTSQLGLGVQLGEIRRAYSEFLAESARNAVGRFEAAESYEGRLEQLENLLLPRDGDLATAMNAFFNEMGRIAAQPGDPAPRAAAIEQGRTLATAFNTTATVLGELAEATRGELAVVLSEVNEAASALGVVNGRLRSSNIGGSPPNALLDERDRLIGEIAARVPVMVGFGGREEAVLRFGSSAAGPVFVEGESALPLTLSQSDDGGTLLRLGVGTVISAVESGAARGLREAYDLTRRVLSELDGLARRMSTELNAQHAQGIDLDGQHGREMFGVAAFGVDTPTANRGSAEAIIRIVPGVADAFGDLRAEYSARTDSWTLRDAGGAVLATGRSRIEFAGGVIDISGRPADGDAIRFPREAGEALRMAFLLTRGEQIAAASTVAISPATTNTGSARLGTAPAEPAPSAIPSLSEVMTNNLSPAAAQGFLRGGAAVSIPRGTTEVALASLSAQATATLPLNALSETSELRLSVDGVTRHVDLAAFRADAGNADLATTADLAAFLNAGLLKAATRDAAGNVTFEVSLRDLGLAVAAFDGGITLAARQGQGIDALSAVQQGGVAVKATVKPAVAASEIRILTREGRQIAGAPLSAFEAAQLVTEANGFVPQAQYRADYSNVASGVGYRGTEITQATAEGLHRLSLTLPALAGAAGGVVTDRAAPETQAQTLTVDLSGVARGSVTIPAGVDATYVAGALSAELAAAGLSVSAQTVARLDLDAAGDGAVSFDIAGLDGAPVTVSAGILGGDLTGLVRSINARQAQTGVAAELAAGGRSLNLLQAEGRDIALSGLVASVGIGFGVSARSAAQAELSTPVPFAGPLRITGELTMVSAAAFSLTSSAAPAAPPLASARDAMTGGLVTRSFSEAGSRATLDYTVLPEVDALSQSVDGTRLHAPSAVYTLAVPGSGLAAEVRAADLPVLDAATVAGTLLSGLRKGAAVPVLTGRALSAGDVPPVGTEARFLLGGAEYRLVRVEDGNPARLTGADFRVEGPEPDRILVSVTETNAIRLTLREGQVSGSGFAPVSEAEAAAFGLAGAGIARALNGRAVGPPTAPGDVSMDIALAGGTLRLTRQPDGLLRLHDAADPAVFAEAAGGVTFGGLTVTETAEPDGRMRLVLSTGGAAPIVTPGEGARALGFDVARLDLSRDGGRIVARSTDGSAAQVAGTGRSAAGSFVRLENLPDEELIVLVGNEGARRLSASFDIGPPPGPTSRAAEEFDVRMLDAATGRVELFDRETGESIATRTSNGLARFNIAGIDVELAGFAETGDSFVLATGQRLAGDSRNVDSLVALGQSGLRSNSFQDQFRSIAAGAGASLQAARLTRISAEALRDAAVAAEDDVSGVNLDEEAAKLIEQQQAYQAAARILQTAREMFDSLLQIR